MEAIDLERRLASVERAAGSIGDEQRTLVDRLAALEGVLSGIKHREIERLLGHADTAAYALETPARAAGAATVDARATLIANAEEDVQSTAQLLQQTHELAQFVDGAAFQALPQHVAALAPLQLTHDDQTELMAQLTERVHQVLAAYNDNVSVISQVFLEWDRRVTAAERLVSRLHAQKAHQQQ